MDIVTNGTVMINRKNMPQQKNIIKIMKRGDLQSYWKGNLMTLMWKDKRLVIMLSTMQTGNKFDIVDVPNKNPNNPSTLKPQTIFDWLYKENGWCQPCLPFYFNRPRKTFLWLLEVGTINACLLYKSVYIARNLKPMLHKVFRVKIIKSLCEWQSTIFIRVFKHRTFIWYISQ